MSIRDQIHNYYENRVIDLINTQGSEQGYSQEQLIDLTCLALNNLPTRYYRHEVDLAFYMSAQEHDDIDRRVRKAVKDAFDFVESHNANS